MRALALLVTSLLPLAAQAIEPAALGADALQWTFRVLLDGSPIGEHRFSLRKKGETWDVASDARFEIKLLGFTAYRYRHQASETWQRGCLVALESTTDDDGTPSKVSAATEGGVLVVKSSGDTRRLRGCSFSYAYWNAAMLKQTTLINAQTGLAEPVRISRVGDGSLDVRGSETAAVRWRINGPANPLDLWYSPQGDWLGLDSTVAGGRKLSYRLESTP